MQYFDSSQADQTFKVIASRLQAEVDRALTPLRAITNEQAGVPTSSGKWSPKQILGHLIDSAANNHQRFVRGQAASELHLPGYEQMHWVESQHYNDRFWLDLVDLWASYNRHLAHIMTSIPESRRGTPCAIGDNPVVTLSYIALDYVGHIQHHLRQIFDRPRRDA